MVHHFEHRDGTLFAEDVNLNALAEKVGTPFYVYSSATLRRHVRVVKQAFEGIPTLLAYAMKANSNQAVLKLMASEGAGADVVSLGELERALAAGIRPEMIVFSGVAKTVAEMRRGLEAGHPLLQRRKRTRTRTARHGRRLDRQGRARLGPHQSRCRCQHPCQDFHRQGREQVRHSLCPRPRGL